MSKQKKMSNFEEKLNDWVAKYLTHIPAVQKIFFVEHLETMVHAGLSLMESLNILSREISNRKFKQILIEVQKDVEEGKQLSEALAKHPKAFPGSYVKMIEAGEIAGKLEESLKQIGMQMKKNYELNSSIRSAMVYPSVIIVAMGGIAIMMVTVVLPKLMLLFKDFDTELPLSTRILIGITEFMSNPVYMSIVIALIISLIVLFVVLLKKSVGFKHTIHNFNLHLPIFGKVIKKINLARFSLTISSLLKSTIPIVEATDITADTCTNVLYRNALHETAKRIKSGQPLSEILAEYDKLFPPMVTEMIMVGERSGEVDDLLEKISDFYNKEVDKTMKNFTTIIEPVIIITIGIAVAGMAMAIIMPMYTLVQNF